MFAMQMMDWTSFKIDWDVQPLYNLQEVEI